MKGLTVAIIMGLTLTGFTAPQASGAGLWDWAGCHGSDCDSACCDGSCTDGGCCDSIAGCDSACGCGMDGCLERLTRHGCLRPSQPCFDDFISPMINFVFFEDPRTLTELRPIFVHHNLPSAVSGGAVQLYAVQFRIALTERLSLIAVKDGFIVDKVHDGALDDLLDDGWADVSAGLKYNLLSDECRGTLASVGFTYELPVGSKRALQNVADGEFHLFATGGQRFFDGNAHWLTSFGVRLPADSAAQTDSLHWSNHFDVRVTDRTYLVTELAWWHWTGSADQGLALGVGGQDLFNLPSTNVSGNDLVTQNIGLKCKPSRNMEAGLAYEFPLTGFKDVIDNRVQLDLIFRY